MIRVIVKRNPQKEIKSVEISGHAFYANKGKDIVCAAVSAISLSMMNAMAHLLEITPVIKQGKSGYFYCEPPSDIVPEKKASFFLLLEAMVAQIYFVAVDYKDYIDLQDENYRGGGNDVKN